jgi:hypothetical protein
MDKDDETNRALKNLVKEIVSKLVYKLVRASAQNTVAGLRKKLKEEAIRKIEDKLKETAEEQLEEKLAKTGRQLGKEIAKDNPDGPDYESQLRQSFEKDCGKFLSSLKGMSSLAVTVITSACTLVIGGVIGWVVVYKYIEPTPPLPQPDLVITEITFDIEERAETLELEPPPELPAGSLWLWEGTSPYQLTIHYVIENQGDAEAGASTSCLFLDGKLIAEDTVSPLAPGENAEGAFYDYLISIEDLVPFLESGHIDIVLRADAGNMIEESNEENNAVTLIADLPCN